LDVVTVIRLLVASPAGSLTPKDGRRFLRLLLATPSTLAPSGAFTLCNSLCTGVNALTPTVALQLLDAYPGHTSPIPATEFAALVQSLHTTVNGLDASQIRLLLSKLSPGGQGLVPTRARSLIVLLMTGGSALDATQVFGVVDTLFATLNAPTGLRSIKTAELLERLINGDHGENNGITPSRSRQLIQSLVVNFTPVTLHELATKKTQLQGGPVLSPYYLYSCSQVVGIHTFAPLAHAAHTGGHVSFQELIDIIGQASESLVPAVNLCTLLHYLPTVPTSKGGRAYRIKKFLREAAGHATWAAIFGWVADFVSAGRAPFTTGGGPFSPFAQTGTNTGGVAMAIQRNRNPGCGVLSFRVSDYRINYFCNSHSFRYFDFTRANRAPQISLWAPATTRQNVIDMVRTALDNGTLDGLLNDAVNDPGSFTSTSAYSADSDADNGGIYYDNSNIFYLHHFHSVGVGGETIRKEVLLAIAWLFD
jgi:hypothetical protein